MTTTETVGHRSNVLLPAELHHQLSHWLTGEAATLGVAPKWVSQRAAIHELVALALTDEATTRKLRKRLAARVGAP